MARHDATIAGGDSVSSMTDWEWDETLYAGSAPYYSIGRMPYPPRLAEVIRDELGLDGSGRLLDVGCGPGSLTLMLAPLFASAVGVDADAGMIEEARRRAGEDGDGVVLWRHLRAEELPAGLGTFRVVTFAQSFHWMDQPLVARRVRGMLEPGGAWVHVSAITDRGADGAEPLGADGAEPVGADGAEPLGADGTEPLGAPRPPWDAIAELIAGHLGPVRRAGRGFLPAGTRSGEEDVMRAAGYTGPHRVAVARGEIVTRTPDEIVAAVFSHSGSAPHLFGDRLPAFEGDLRRLLGAGPFAERLGDVDAVFWRP